MKVKYEKADINMGRIFEIEIVIPGTKIIFPRISGKKITYVGEKQVNKIALNS
jgi:hypothetical protein